MKKMKKRKLIVAVLLLIVTGSAMAYTVGWAGSPVESTESVKNSMEAAPHFGKDNFVLLIAGVVGLGLARKFTTSNS